MINQRKRVAKRLASGLLAGAVAFGGLAISGASPAGAIPVDLDSDQRLSGADRYATAAEVAEYIEDEAGLEVVLIANGDNFPDALAASSLLEAEGDGAIILVQQNSIPVASRAFLNSVDDSVTQVYVIGGESAVSSDVFADIEEIMDGDVDRLAGENRYETALEVADQVGYGNDVVLITGGESWADAVTVGSLAADQQIPVLLANSNGLPEAVSDELGDRIDAGLARAVIVGGTAVVGAGVEDELVELGLDPADVTRIAGPDRYITNLLFQLEVFNSTILETAKNTDNDYDGNDYNGDDLNGRSVVLVTGSNFPDALTAAALAAYEGSHLILTNATGGASALTVASSAKTALDLDIPALGTTVSMAGLGDWGPAGGLFQILYGDTRILEDVWVVGGDAAVPGTAVQAVAAAATDKVDCVALVGAANDNDDISGDLTGPESALIIFSKNLQQVYPAAAYADDGGIVADEYAFGGLADDDGVDTTDSEFGELSANLDDYVDVEGTTVAGWLALDLTGDGFQDAFLVNFNDELDEGAEFTFEGIEQESDIAKYTDDGVFFGLRELGSCTAKVSGDTNGPEVTTTAVIGDNAAFVQFSEPMLEDYEAALEADWGANECEVTDTSTYTTYFCEGGSDWASGDDFEWSEGTYYDAAGNELDNQDFKLMSASAYRPAVTEFTMDCTSIANGGYAEAAWAYNNYTSGAEAATDDGIIEIPLDGDVINVEALSGVPGVSANDWSFTVESQRGLIRPTVAVDGTDVTVTIDSQYHDGEDIARAINSSEIGRGFGGKWSADQDGGLEGVLIDSSDLGDAFDTSTNTTATQSCAWSATFSMPLGLNDAGGLNDYPAYQNSTLTTGDFQIVMDGDIVDDDEYDLGWGIDGDNNSGGLVLSGTIDGIDISEAGAKINWKWVTTSSASAE